MARKSDETRTELGNACHKALRTIVEWIGPLDGAQDQQLVDVGVMQESSQEILQRLFQEVGPLAAELKVDVGLANVAGTWQFASDITWDDWNSSSRRVRQSGPDEDILYHLRGNKNEVFKLTG